MLIAVSAVIYVVVDARRSEARRHLEELQGELAWLLKKQEIEKLVTKSVAATAADARERDRKKAEDDAQRAMKLAQYKRAYDRSDRCRWAIRDQMKYLEPIISGSISEEALPDGGWKVRQRVRLSDSFSGAAVGDIECEFDANDQIKRIERIRR